MVHKLVLSVGIYNPTAGLLGPNVTLVTTLLDADQ